MAVEKETNVRLISLWLLLLLALVPAAAPASAMAVSIVVTQCDDAGFSAALTSALPGDTITFNCGGPATIPVLSTKTLSTNLTIDGANNGSPVVFSGGAARRVFAVPIGSTVALRNMTIRDGKVTSPDKGGGINNAGSLTLDNVELRNNTADVFTGSGVYSNGSLTLQSSRVISNTTEGIFHEVGTLNVQQSVITGNGTGITVNSGNALVSQSTVANNARAISSFNCTMTILDTTVSGNTTMAIANGCMLTVRGTTFSGNNNIYSNGAALANIFGNVGTIVVDQSTFVGNTATGGGSALLAGGVVTVTNSTFASNTTSSFGAGTIVGTGQSLAITNSTVSNNTNPGATAAAVNISFGSVSPMTTVLTNVTIAGNTGRGLVQSAGTVSLANTIVSGNSAGNCAGTLSNGGYNLSNDGTCVGFLSGDPQLGMLANNGGPTQTRMLAVGSPAVDRIPASLCPAADQRGVARPMPHGGLCDIGAVEVQPTVYLPLVRR